GVLYSFDGAEDGQYPYAGLINVKGTLYGTTSEGDRKRQRDGFLDHDIRQRRRASWLQRLS
ncbi:MAG: hypothetical protein WBV40_06870, partial [Candidatus Cybelea sp.]